MAKTDSLQGSLDLLVLKVLSRRPKTHGYGIMAAIKEASEEVLRAAGTTDFATYRDAGVREDELLPDFFL